MKQDVILVTGASGFIGQSLVHQLLKKNTTKRIVTIEREKKEKENSQVVTYFGDITDWDFIESVFKKNKIDICFHLAGQALVEVGKENPRRTLKTNIEGTWNILEACRTYNVKKVIIASSAHVYGNSTHVPYKEYDIPRPSRIYETSKVSADLIAQSYLAAYNLPVFIARFTNIYGPGDTNLSRIIPRTIKSILENKNPQIWGGTAIRDYLYIDDAVNAYIKLALLDSSVIKNHIFNFGGGNPISVKDLVSKILTLSGNDKLRLITNKTEREDEIKVQYVSWEKAKRTLRWKPKHTLETGLKKTLLWYKKHYLIHE